jgi:hypothetical protein
MQMLTKGWNFLSYLHINLKSYSLKHSLKIILMNTVSVLKITSQIHDKFHIILNTLLTLVFVQVCNRFSYIFITVSLNKTFL